MGKWIHRLFKPNFETMTAICKNCGPVSIVFKKTNNKNIARCKNAVLAISGDYKYENVGITFPEWFKYKKEKGCCEICGIPDDLCLDHSSKLSKFRGVLCRKCNLGLGFFKDSTNLLEKAIKYLDEKNV